MRAYGHVRDEGRPAGLIHHAHLVGDVSVPPTAVLDDEPDDQSIAQSCTGFGYGRLVDVYARARGLFKEKIAPRATYGLGRAITLADPYAPLVDQGANPSAVVEGMRLFGLVPESVCPYDVGRINERLTFYELELARTWRVTDIAVIEDVYAERCAAIRRAIAAKYPVGFGMSVDQSYEDLSGSTTYAGPTGPSKGLHAQRITGYRPGAFLITGSWGPFFGDGGYAWISDAVIGDPNLCFDFYVLRAAPVVP